MSLYFQLVGIFSIALLTVRNIYALIVEEEKQSVKEWDIRAVFTANLLALIVFASIAVYGQF